MICQKFPLRIKHLRKLLVFALLQTCSPLLFSQQIGERIDLGDYTYEISSLYPNELKVTHCGNGRLQQYNIPSTLYISKYRDYFNVTSIGSDIFPEYKPVMSILSIPTTVKSIEDNAFLKCDFREINIPATVESLSPVAFPHVGKYLAYVIDRSGRFPQPLTGYQYENAIVVVPVSAYSKMLYSSDGTAAYYKQLEVFGLNFSQPYYNPPYPIRRKFINSGAVRVGETFEFEVTSIPSKSVDYEIIKGEDVISFIWGQNPLLYKHDYHTRQDMSVCPDDGIKADCYIKGLKEGEAIIRFTNSEGETKDFEIAVVDAFTSSISLPKNVEVEVGVPSSLDITVVPENARKAFNWGYETSSSNITIDKYGNFTAHTAGQHIVQARASDGSNRVSNWCTIRAIDRHELSLPSWMEKDTIKAEVGKTYECSVTYKGGTAEIPVTVSFDNNEIARLNDDGEIVMLKKGVTKMTVTSQDNPEVKKEVLLHTFLRPTSVKFEFSKDTIYVGDTIRVKATILPEDADYTMIGWNRATSVDSTGFVATVICKSPGRQWLGVSVKCVELNLMSLEWNRGYDVFDHLKRVRIKSAPKAVKVGGSGEVTFTISPEEYLSPLNYEMVSTDSTSIKIERFDKNYKGYDGTVKFKALKPGKTDIIVKVKDISGAEVKDSVSIYAVSVTWDDRLTDTNLAVGDTTSVSINILPEDFPHEFNKHDYHPYWIYRGHPENAIEIDPVKRTIKALSADRSAYVYASLENYGCYLFSDFKSFKISEPIISIDEKNSKRACYVGDTLHLTKVCTPYEFLNGGWKSGNEEILSVDEEGNVIALYPNATVMDLYPIHAAVYYYGYTKAGKYVEGSYSIYVQHIVPEKIELDPKEYSGLPGDSFRINATVYPDNATFQEIKWSSSDEKVATVDDNGVVSLLNVGECRIRGNCRYCNYVYMNVTVKPILVESITLDNTEWNGFVGESFQLNATVSPENASDGSIWWTSSDGSVAYVDSNTGRVKLYSKGSAIITASTRDGSALTAQCRVTARVKGRVESIALEPSEWSGSEGNSFTIKATVSPEDAINKELNWSSSNNRIAIVTKEGRVIVLQSGSAIITATSRDGSNVSAQCRISAVSGIDGVPEDAGELFDVYDIQGILVRSKCDSSQLKMLKPGVYIILLRNGTSRKIMIK